MVLGACGMDGFPGPPLFTPDEGSSSRYSSLIWTGAWLAGGLSRETISEAGSASWMMSEAGSANWTTLEPVAEDGSPKSTTMTSLDGPTPPDDGPADSSTTFTDD